MQQISMRLRFERQGDKWRNSRKGVASRRAGVLNAFCLSVIAVQLVVPWIRMLSERSSDILILKLQKRHTHAPVR